MLYTSFYHDLTNATPAPAQHIKLTTTSVTIISMTGAGNFRKYGTWLWYLVIFDLIWPNVLSWVVGMIVISTSYAGSEEKEVDLDTTFFFLQVGSS